MGPISSFHFHFIKAKETKGGLGFGSIVIGEELLIFEGFNFVRAKFGFVGWFGAEDFFEFGVDGLLVILLLIVLLLWLWLWLWL